MSSGRDFGTGFLAGFLAAVVIGVVFSVVLLRRTEHYGLGHWKLNIKTPLRSMWMNVGYWRNAQGEKITDFPEASASLLREVLSTAGLINDGNTTPGETTALLDLGFGCGDQTWDLIQMLHATRTGFRYVGLSLNNDQVQSAQRRICREVANHAEMSEHTLNSTNLFCANAAKPETWDNHVAKTVESLSDVAFTERWLLALDCLYHFKPSRKPVFKLAASKLRANIMVFDLVLNEKASSRDIWIARAISVMMRCPVRTFVTEEEYKDQLVECGYERDLITIRDITEHVFSGLVAFIDRQDAALAEYSISIGGFKLAQRLFDWFDRSHVVKAVIVVARVKDSK